MNLNNIPNRGRPRLPEKVCRTVKRCCYGLCTNDSKSCLSHELDQLTFFNFPLPCLQYRNALPGSEFRKRHKIGECDKCGKCKRWLHRCRRVGLTMDTIGYSTFICSQHFPSGKNAVIENEEPYPATCSESWKKYKRPPPKPRSPVSTRKRRTREDESHTYNCSSTELVAMNDTQLTADPDNVNKTIKKIKAANQEMKITAIWSCRDIFPDIANVSVTQSTQTDSCPSKFQELSTQTDFSSFLPPGSCQSNSQSSPGSVKLSNQINKNGKLLPNLFKFLPQPRSKVEEWTQTELSFDSQTVIAKRVGFDVANLLEMMDSSWAFKINDGSFTLLRHSGSTIEICLRLTSSSFDIEVYGHPLTKCAVLDPLRTKFVTEGAISFVRELQNSTTCNGIDEELIETSTSTLLCSATGRLRSVNCDLLLVDKSQGLCIPCTYYEKKLIKEAIESTCNRKKSTNTHCMSPAMLQAALRARKRLENEGLRKIGFLRDKIAKPECLKKSID